MTLNFPNPARSFDEARNAVRFFGYEGLREIRFFVEAKALAKVEAEASPMSEEKCLSAFDRLRAAIHNVAREAYSHKRLDSYTLSAGDFR
jgi:hypothetical protein